MPIRSAHLFPTDLDTGDPNFRAKCLGMMDQIRSEMDATIALTKVTIAESRVAIAKADRILRRR